MRWLAALALGAVLHPSFAVRDIDGVERHPFETPKGGAQALFFVTQDCPVANYYAHEIRRICDEYGQRGVGCALVYVDPTLSDAQARQHASDYGHGSYPKFVDRTHELVKTAGATITPEAVIVKPDGAVAYRGRIDDFYAALGKPRRVVREHDVRDALDSVLAGRPVANPETHAVGCYIPPLSAFGPPAR